MNTFAKVDTESFLRFASEHPQQRYELERGRIVQQMPGGTRRHHVLARKIARSIEDQIDATRWTVVPEHGVKIGDCVRYPDIVVEPIDEPGTSLATERPVMIVEVLSPLTTATDLNTKPAEYLSIAALDAYVVASQDEPAMLVWQRDDAGRFPQTGVEISGAGNMLKLAGRFGGVTLKLGEIYDGIC